MGVIVSFQLTAPGEMAKIIAKRLRSRRLALNLSQKTLSERSGVSYGTLKKFEGTGQISLESLLKLALVLDAFEDFKDIFAEKEEDYFAFLDEIIEDKPRKRGRR